MPISFPPSPTVGQNYSYGGKTYRWTGDFWTTVSATDPPAGNGSLIVVSPTAPENPTQNMLWLNTSVT